MPENNRKEEALIYSQLETKKEVKSLKKPLETIAVNTSKNDKEELKDIKDTTKKGLKKVEKAIKDSDKKAMKIMEAGAKKNNEGLEGVAKEIVRSKDGIVEAIEGAKPDKIKVELEKQEGRNHLVDVFFDAMRGDKGDSPVKGVDYFTEEEAKAFLEVCTPVKGLDYFTDKEVEGIVKSVKKGLKDDVKKEVSVDKVVKEVLGKIEMPNIEGLISADEVANQIEEVVKAIPDENQIYAKVAKHVASKTVSLSELDDVDLSNLTQNADGKYILGGGGSGSGDVVGPASATDNAIARYDSTTGKLIQNSGVTINDSDEVSGVKTLTVSPTGNNKAIIANGSGSGTALEITHSGAGKQIDGVGFDVDSDGDTTVKSLTATEKVDYAIAIGGVSALGNLGATEAIDWSTATHFTGTLDADVTITHTNEVEGQKITIALAYDGSAQRTITWSDVDKWQEGTAPDAPSASGEVLLVTLVRLGTTVYGSGAIFS